VVSEPSAPCQDCGAPLAWGQRYCIECGRRTGARSPQLIGLLRAQGLAGTPRPTPDAEAETRWAPLAQTPARPGLTLPSLRVSMLLVLVFLGFGILLGNIAGSRVKDTLAASRQPLKVVLAPSSTPAAASRSSSSSASSSSNASSTSEPPETEAAATPAPATASAKTTPARNGPSGHGHGSRPGASTGAGKAGEGASSGEGGSAKGAPGGPRDTLPPIKHVFVIMLSDQPYAAVFGPASTAPYLAQTLERQGELLVHYDAVAHQELANELALLSGQGPTAETAANCPTYAAIVATGSGPDEQVLGNGCVYPSATQTLVAQLSAEHLSWHAYVQGLDEGGGQLGACAHPALGQPDPGSGLTPAEGPYGTFIDPFVYFQSITGSPTCSEDVVGLDRLRADLASPSRTPSFSYLAPDRCDDGNPTPCTSGAPAGLAPADGFLQRVVPEIMASKAYKESGLLVITVDEAPSSGEFADSSSCCGQPRFPNLPGTTSPGGLSPRGGGAVGALLLSPFIKGGATSQEPYNHFSLLRTIEDVFGLEHLGYAALPAVRSLEASIFSSH
jgi:phosphatidylinositol-3-phosphatase